jgi:hypothetical protein
MIVLRKFLESYIRSAFTEERIRLLSGAGGEGTYK